MTDIDKIWGELVEKRLDRCVICGSIDVRVLPTADEPNVWCGGCQEWIFEKPTESVALTKSDLSALVERVREEAVKEYREAEILKAVEQIGYKVVKEAR